MSAARLEVDGYGAPVRFTFPGPWSRPGDDRARREGPVSLDALALALAALLDELAAAYVDDVRAALGDA